MKKLNKKSISIAVASILLIVTFQNCAKSGFDTGDLNSAASDLNPTPRGGSGGSTTTGGTSGGGAGFWGGSGSSTSGGSITPTTGSNSSNSSSSGTTTQVAATPSGTNEVSNGQGVSNQVFSTMNRSWSSNSGKWSGYVLNLSLLNDGADKSSGKVYVYILNNNKLCVHNTRVDYSYAYSGGFAQAGGTITFAGGQKVMSDGSQFDDAECASMNMALKFSLSGSHLALGDDSTNSDSTSFYLVSTREQIAQMFNKKWKVMGNDSHTIEFVTGNAGGKVLFYENGNLVCSALVQIGGNEFNGSVQVAWAEQSNCKTMEGSYHYGYSGGVLTLQAFSGPAKENAFNLSLK